MDASSLYYRDHLEPAEQAERQRQREHAERVAAPTLPLDQPQQDGEAYRLRKFAAGLIEKKRWYEARSHRNGNWRDMLNDSEEILTLSAEVAAALEPIIIHALALADAKDKQ